MYISELLWNSESLKGYKNGHLLPTRKTLQFNSNHTSGPLHSQAQTHIYPARSLCKRIKTIMSKSTQGTPTLKTAATFTQSAAVNASSASSTQESLQDASRFNMPGPHALPQQPNDGRLPLAMIRYLQEPAKAGGPVYSVMLEASRALGDLEDIIDAIGFVFFWGGGRIYLLHHTIYRLWVG